MKYYAQVENKIAYKLGLITAQEAMKPVHIGGKEYTRKIFTIDRDGYEKALHNPVTGTTNNRKTLVINGVLVPDKYVFAF